MVEVGAGILQTSLHALLCCCLLVPSGHSLDYLPSHTDRNRSSQSLKWTMGLQMYCGTIFSLLLVK